MNPQRKAERHVDPLVIRISGMICELESIREEIERRNAAELSDRAGMLSAAGQLARSDYLSNKELAGYLGCSPSKVQHMTNRADDPLACIFRGRIGSGRMVKYARRRIEVHLANMDEHKTCGECDRIAFTGPQRRAQRA